MAAVASAPMGLNQPEAPQFFKVLLSPLDHGIQIPHMFMRKYGRGLSNTVFLKVPVGVAWPVELVHSDRHTWLYKGWQEFAKFYSIKKFDFLVFRYDGNSQFHVTIFDHNACLEIDYPIKSNHEKCVQVGEGEVLANQLQRSRRVTNERVGERSSRNPPKRAKNRNTDAYKTAQNFHSQKPFFVCAMQSSYVSTAFSLNIPADFVRNHSNEIYTDDYELRLAEVRTKTWAVHIIVEKESKTHRIFGGWRKFVFENELVVGDACVFELEQGTKIFNVIIYRQS